MKLKYEKPMLEVEHYELDASIASNCQMVINSGPAHPDHAPCDDYREIIGVSTFSINGPKYNIDFYDDCDCYYSASGIFFTS